jgi:hypothetical protein
MDDSMNLLPTQMGTKVTRQYTMIPRSAAFQAYAAMQGITTKVYVNKTQVPDVEAMASKKYA